MIVLKLLSSINFNFLLYKDLKYPSFSFDFDGLAADSIRACVYHKRGNHTVTLYEKRVKIRYNLRGSPLG